MDLLKSKFFWGSLIVIMTLMSLLREYGDLSEKQKRYSKGIWPPPELTDLAKPIPPLSKLTHDKNIVETKAVPLLNYKGRIIIGNDLKSFKNSKKQIVMLNRFNKDWKDLLIKNLGRFQPPDVKISVDSRQSYVQVENNEGRYLEEVYIETQFPTGKINSFKALVDSQNGRIVDSWDWGRSEKIPVPLDKHKVTNKQ